MSTSATMSDPTKNPSTICIYEYDPAYTAPGTEMNVTPEMLAPIIAIATIYHGDLRLPVKNPALSALRPVIHEMIKSSKK